MNLTGLHVFEIFNGSEYSGTIIYNQTLLFVILAVGIIVGLMSIVFNMKSSKIANKVINPKTKRVDKSIKLTEEDNKNIKKYDMMKYVSLGLAVVIIFLSVKLTTSVFDGAGSIKDSQKFKDYVAPVSEVMKDNNGTIEKSGDKYILTQTVKGKVSGDKFKLDNGLNIDTKVVKGLSKDTKAVKIVTTLDKDSKVTVNKDKNQLVADGDAVVTAVK